jgi:flavin reductase (DIM6/NTAB) family NADH-FMN oxidoreductase RutF
MKDFNKITPDLIGENIFKLIGEDWMLITAGNKEKANTMTASWGGMGVLWHLPVCFAFIRKSRYTYEFAERESLFTLSFFNETYRDTLNYCGAHSGRNEDKIVNCGLTLVETENGAPAFNEASLVVECRKIYFDDIIPEHFLDSRINRNYPSQDYHRMYIGEVIGVYVK